ncbi:MAG: hypothetical protein AAFQ53_13645, partial [Bacteroidota bacterium]
RGYPARWEIPESPFRATYVPARLGSTSLQIAGNESRVVLAAPGTDVFDDAIPERMIDEIMTAVRGAPSIQFLFLTRNVDRVAEAGLPPNAVAVVHATYGEEVVALAAQIRDAASDSPTPAWAVVLRDLATPPVGGFGGVLDVFDWVLVRGAATTWDALRAVYATVPTERIHVSKEVRARPEANPLLARLSEPITPERLDREAVPVKVSRDPGGPALPTR